MGTIIQILGLTLAVIAFQDEQKHREWQRNQNVS